MYWMCKGSIQFYAKFRNLHATPNNNLKDYAKFKHYCIVV